MSVNQVNVTLDAEHFGALHNQYRNRLLNSMTGIVRDREAAEEITASAFAKAFEKRNSFRGESLPYTWLFAIGLNEARQYWGRNRAVSLESLTGAAPQALVECDSAADKLQTSDEGLKLQKALRQIPAIYRRALVDHFVHGYSTKQIARREGIPLGTVLSRLFTGRKLLRKVWKGL